MARPPARHHFATSLAPADPFTRPDMSLQSSLAIVFTGALGLFKSPSAHHAHMLTLVRQAAPASKE